MLPRAVSEPTTVWTEAEIDIVLNEVLNPIPAPATSETLDEVPLSEKFVAAGTVGPITVMAGEFDN